MGNLHRLADERVRRLWEGVAARTLEGNGLTLAIIEIAPHSSIPEHRHPNEQIGVLAAGRMRLTVGGETQDLEPGGAWRVPSEVLHSARTGPEGAVAIEAFAPRRDDWHTLPLDDPHAPRWPAE